MKPWKIEYYASGTQEKSVENILDELTDEQLKSIAKEMKLLETCGNTLRLPHSKSLGKGLFELRERRFGYRIYYAFFSNKVIILLHAGIKSSQRNDIKTARNRLVEILKETGDKYEN